MTQHPCDLYTFHQKLPTHHVGVLVHVFRKATASTICGVCFTLPHASGSAAFLLLRSRHEYLTDGLKRRDVPALRVPDHLVIFV
uniref:Uncharacterized protein n=1 Tax=Arundo donax TaxID=35708 RepID=A0A0A9FAW5_ARUDO